MHCTALPPLRCPSPRLTSSSVCCASPRVFGSSIGVNSVAAALVGLTILLVSGVTSWKECLSNNQAWDTLTWFAALIAMAAYLNKEGFIPWFSGQVKTHGAHPPPPPFSPLHLLPCITTSSAICIRYNPPGSAFPKPL